MNLFKCKQLFVLFLSVTLFGLVAARQLRAQGATENFTPAQQTTALRILRPVQLSRGSVGDDPARDINTVVGQSRDQFMNKKWTWKHTRLPHGSLIQPRQTKAFTLFFQGRTVTATTDCNTYYGRYALGKNRRITVTLTTHTKMNCEETQEEEYIEQLKRVSRYSIQRRSLLLHAKNSSTMVFEFVKKSDLMAKQFTTERMPIQSPTTDLRQIPTTNDIADYPYIVKPLTQIQLSALRAEFASSNKNVCAQINDFGFTEFQSGCFGETVRREITDETSIVEIAKNWLVQNSKFTGIPKESDVVVDRVVKLEGCIKCEAANVDRKVIGLRIDFRDQSHNGLPVEGDRSSLTVFAHANGISRIDGHWFPKITIPLQPKISESSAKNKLNGRIFTHSDVAGNPKNYRVEQKDLDNAAHTVVFVKKSSQGLEFRLAWKIPVGQEFFWTAYIDALTGEELKVVQMFQT
jgi:heat shock protein HslJ